MIFMVKLQYKHSSGYVSTLKKTTEQKKTQQ